MDDNPYRSPLSGGASERKFHFPGGLTLVGWMLVVAGLFFAVFPGGGGLVYSALLGVIAVVVFYAVGRSSP
jgi:hypothetical protein